MSTRHGEHSSAQHTGREADSREPVVPHHLARLAAFLLTVALLALASVPVSALASPPHAANFAFSFGATGTGDGQLDLPQGIAIDSSGNLWVVDGFNNRVEKFNSKGEYLSKFGTKGAGEGQFSVPDGIAIDSSGNLWVVDHYNHRVEKFNSKGEYLSKFGTKGTGNGQFEYPNGIAIDSSGDLWVTDALNHRVQKFNAKGEYLSKFGSEGTGEGQFTNPQGIAIDSSGDLWVADTWSNIIGRVEKFNSKGEYLSEFGEFGTGEGQLYGPQGIAIDSSGDLWVTDSGNDRVQKWVTGIAAALSELAVTEPFNGSPESLSDFSGKWLALGWAGGGTPKGENTVTGWRPVAAYPTVNGAFYGTTLADTGSGIAAVATMAVNPGNTNRYFSIWLDLSSEASARTGYELRFTQASAGIYNVALSKWEEGSQSLLASKSSYSFANGSSFALVDYGSTVSAWTDTGSGFAELLSAIDSTFEEGNAAVEGSGNITRLTNFREGSL